MIIDSVTLFPSMFDGFLNESIVQRAINDGYVKVNLINPRDFTLYKNQLLKSINRFYLSQ